MATFDMVFEGGGAKGIAFVGALEAFIAAKHQSRRLIGTSAGAITATLVAAGFTPQELREAVTERLPNGKPRFSTFMDRPTKDDFSDEVINNSLTMEAFTTIQPGPLDKFLDKLDRRVLNLLLRTPLYPQLFSFVECGGLFAGNAFIKWLEEKLQTKGIDKDATFATFHAKNPESDLSLVASDTTDKEMLVLNHRTAPQCPLVMGVRMSMSIPFVWQAIVWDERWGQYCKRPKAGNSIVDGGVLSNFPIRLIAERNDEIMGETDPNAALNLGLLIDETKAVPGVSGDAKKLKLAGRLRTIQRVTELVDTMTDARDNEAIRQHQSEVCRVPAKGYGTTEFDMSVERLEKLIEGGRLAMQEYLATHRL
jgi:predicted acylesterase/phospholipase RssA